MAPRPDFRDLTPTLLASQIASPFGLQLQLFKALQHGQYSGRRLLLPGTSVALLKGKGPTFQPKLRLVYLLHPVTRPWESLVSPGLGLSGSL